ncbi:major facilitator superfamily domain-containing protein [Podospora australis]|uniref:Major facilitator superfamily domain-containing protein n=1 Tax=Podospora australis TaxID=1536484 RepID=A0AAN6WWK1_9PEZI|nr:major facilitator superfamily domain-containing protein [Podospora australis]
MAQPNENLETSAGQHPDKPRTRQNSEASLLTDRSNLAANNPNANSPITNYYLTFSTHLPAVNSTHASAALGRQEHQGRQQEQHQQQPSLPPLPLPPPDLTPYSDPQTWPSHRKSLLLSLSCIATFLTAYTAGSYSPPQLLIQSSLTPTPSVEAVLVGITMFCMGFALTPMALAPLSEMNGRYPVFVAAGTIYVIFQAVCGVVTTIAGMLVSRFLVGAGASVFSTMVGGVIADIYDQKERNTPMALFSGFVLAGTGAGPLVGAVMAERLGDLGGDKWKWVWWHQVLMSGVLMVALVVLFKESRGSVLLSRKAKALNQWYEKLEEQGYYGVCMEEREGIKDVPNPNRDAQGHGEDEEKRLSMEPGSTPITPFRRIRWLVREDEERTSLVIMITVSISRPFHLLFTEPVVFFFSLWVSFAWGVLYLSFGSIPLVLQREYNWSLEQAGYVFTALIVGAVLATIIGIWQEDLLSHPKWAGPIQVGIGVGDSSSGESPSSSSDESKDESSSAAWEKANPGPVWAFLRRHFPASSPESRLYFSCITSTLLPIGLFIFGFTARPETHWIVPSIGLTLATMGILSIYLAVFNYFADIYHKYASSALAAQSFCRNVLGGAFPLVTRPLFENLGQAKAAAVLGGISFGLTIVPWILVFFGDRIRGRSPFAIQLQNSQ